MSPTQTVTRRSVLAGGVLGAAGLVVGFHFLGAGTAKRARAQPRVFQPNAYLRIAADGRVTAIIGCSEMGQGINTALAVVLADELDADWKSVEVEAAPVDPAFGNPFFQGIQATAASTSVAVFYDTTRQAAAAARMMLVEAASRQWKVATAACRTESGKVLGPSGQRLSYGELVEAASRLTPPAPKALKLKEAKDFKLIGRSTPRIEGPRQVTGTLTFGLDFTVPGVLVAVVARAPVPGAKVKTYESAEAAKAPGVRAVVAVPSGIAIIADHYWAASRARALLRVEWDLGEGGALSSREIGSRYRKLAEGPGAVAVSKGDVAGELSRAKAIVEAEYSVPYLAHAPMEPLNCTIRADQSGCDVWVGTQYQSLDRKLVAKILALPEKDVRIHTLYMGGAFGRRGSPNEDVVAETAEILKATRALNAPIQNVWAREDDIRGGFYRPAALNRLRAVLDANGLPKAWLHRIVAQSPMHRTEFEFLVTKGVDETSVAGAKDLPYAIPQLQVELHTPDFGPTVEWMRSVGNSNTCFAIECFVDELAAHARQDPVEYRRKLLAPVKENARLLNVLNIAAEQADWGRARPKGTALGVAVQDFWGTKIAQVAEVSVENGHVRVHRVTCAIDCGLVVNPDGVKSQIEGGIIFGLSAALYGEITLANGQAEQSNFDTYPMTRMNACPQIDVHIVENTEPPGGVGETAVPHIGPAVCNAVFAVTGRRIRSLPLTKNGLTA